MSTEIPIGPNPCQLCGGEYGEHTKDCEARRAVSGRKANAKGIKKYVAGFLFNENETHLALVKKQKGPVCIIGKLNAIGGKVEPKETPLVAMRREFEEETGVKIDDWRKFCKLGNGSTWVVYFYCAFDNSAFQVKTKEAEPVDLYRHAEVMDRVVPNLRWLIPMALDKDSVTAVVNDPTEQ